MGNKLRETLYEWVSNYSTEEYNKSFEEINKYADSDIVITEIDDNNFINVDDITSNTSTSTSMSIADELLKFKELLESELITREEFDILKNKLLDAVND